MKTTYTIAAIAMFAVIMGMSAIAPAMAYHNEDTRSNATTSQCHFDVVYQTEIVEGIEVLILDLNGDPIQDDDLSSWIVLHTSSKGADKGHQKHGDLRVTNDAEALACVTLQNGSVA